MLSNRKGCKVCLENIIFKCEAFLFFKVDDKPTKYVIESAFSMLGTKGYKKLGTKSLVSN